jgi:hypothetical protein
LSKNSEISPEKKPLILPWCKACTWYLKMWIAYNINASTLGELSCSAICPYKWRRLSTCLNVGSHYEPFHTGRGKRCPEPPCTGERETHRERLMRSIFGKIASERGEWEEGGPLGERGKMAYQMVVISLIRRLFRRKRARDRKRAAAAAASNRLTSRSSSSLQETAPRAGISGRSTASPFTSFHVKSK